MIIEGELVDCVWPARRLVIEIDGYGYHRSKRAFEEDRRRDAKLTLAGYRVIRITYDRIVHEPGALIADIRRLLAQV